MTTTGHHLGQLLIRLRVEDAMGMKNGKAAEGWTVYFIQQMPDGPIKIGRSNDPWRRLSVLQTSSPYELKLLGVLRSAGYGTEAGLHQRFSHLRMKGEWFKPEPDLITFINELKQPKRNIEASTIETENHRD